MDALALLGFGQGGWGPTLLSGMVVTLKIAVMAYALGLAIGLLGAIAKLSRRAPLRWLGGTYSDIVRGVPDILIILLIYYGGTSTLRSLIGVIVPGVQVEIDAMAAAVASLGFVCGAYATEVFRGSIQAVPRGQVEAALALGLSPYARFRLIILPQALRIGLPALGNLWVSLLKDTALISVVGLRELLGTAYSASATTRQPFLFYSAAAFLYLGLTVASMVGLQWLERHFGRAYRETR